MGVTSGRQVSVIACYLLSNQTTHLTDLCVYKTLSVISLGPLIDSKLMVHTLYTRKNSYTVTLGLGHVTHDGLTGHPITGREGM